MTEGTGFQVDPKVLAKIRNAPVPTAEEIVASRVAIAGSARPGGDRRGSSISRRRRTEKLLAEFGDGVTCRCAYCPTMLTAATLTQDKIYTGSEGGGYRYANLLAVCLPCNQRRSNATIQEFIDEALAAVADARTYLQHVRSPETPAGTLARSRVRNAGIRAQEQRNPR